MKKRQKMIETTEKPGIRLRVKSVIKDGLTSEQYIELIENICCYIAQGIFDERDTDEDVEIFLDRIFKRGCRQ